MSLVDLAGSERSKRTNNTGERRHEAGAINASLALLKDCLKSVEHARRNGPCSYSFPAEAPVRLTPALTRPALTRLARLPLSPCRALHKNQSKGKHSDIPRFNQSKLTKLFQNYLCGNGMAAMVVRAAPAADRRPCRAFAAPSACPAPHASRRP